MAIEASLVMTANVESAFHDPPTSSSGQVAPDIGNESDIDPVVQPFDSLAISNSEASARFLQALGPNSWSNPLGESSFPPLHQAATVY